MCRSWGSIGCVIALGTLVAACETAPTPAALLAAPATGAGVRVSATRAVPEASPRPQSPRIDQGGAAWGPSALLATRPPGDTPQSTMGSSDVGGAVRTVTAAPFSNVAGGGRAAPFSAVAGGGRTITAAPLSAAADPAASPTSGQHPLPGALSFARPFDTGLEVRGSAFFPYGTDANGQYLLHHGIDVGNPDGTPVLAVGAGTVTYAGSDESAIFGPTPDFYGSLVVVRHPVRSGQDGPSHESGAGSDLYSLYGHLSRTEVTTGETIEAGAVVGLVGSTGVALGPHLHLEFRTSERDYETTVNPALFLRPLPGTGTLVGRLVGADGHLVPEAAVALYRLTGGVPEWAAATVTYPTAHVNSSPGWDENFVFADLPVGSYAVVPAGHDVVPADEVTVNDSGATRVTVTR